jgi:hypothetical protein
MQFRVGRDERDDSRIPGVWTRTLTFTNDTHNGESRWLFNGQPFDPQRIDAQPALGSTEIWYLKTDVFHLIHLRLAPALCDGSAGALFFGALFLLSLGDAFAAIRACRRNTAAK